MILSLAILLLAGQVESDCVRVPRAGGCVRANGRSGAGFAFFEAFPASGAGTSGVCSTTAPTGAKGETLTFTRGSNGTCTKTATGGLATTGIANGDLVSLSSNVARVEYDAQGVLGLLVESSRTNSVLRFIEYLNGAWADVGTPTLTGSQTDPFNTTTAVQFDDNDGAAFEGRSQAVTVSAGAAYTAHCYVKAGTLAKARITLDGTANTITGLSATTWSIIEVTDASSSGVSITLQVLNGDATGDTGTVIWGGCQVEVGSYHTSIIPTTSATVTRSAETATFPGAAFPANPYSLAVSIYPPTGTTQGDLFYGNAGSTSGVGFFFVASLLRAQNCSSGCATFSPAFTPTALTTTRVATSSTGGQQQTFVNGSSIAGPTATAAAATPWATATGIGPGIGQPDAIISRICVDSDPSRCR